MTKPKYKLDTKFIPPTKRQTNQKPEWELADMLRTIIRNQESTYRGTRRQRQAYSPWETTVD